MHWLLEEWNLLGFSVYNNSIEMLMSWSDGSMNECREHQKNHGNLLLILRSNFMNFYAIERLLLCWYWICILKFLVSKHDVVISYKFFSALLQFT